MKQRHRWLIGVLVAVALAALVLIAPGKEGALAQGDTIYVDADAEGDNNGDSWTDAYTDLQLALDRAEEEDQIWVAEGTYTPTAEHGGTGDRYKSFQMVNGVAIYGGFDPSVYDDEWEERDWEANLTILSGDIGIEGNNSDNSYHVFFHPDGTDLDSSAVLDGFTITGGNANGDGDPRYYGGGMYNEGSSPTLSNCTFTDNWGDYGGGMFNWRDSSPTLSNCNFESNSATLYGGGMSNRIDASPALTDCTFEGNLAVDGGGGGMYNEGSSPVLTNCTFSGNSADWAGGMFNYGGSSPTLTDCTFEGNLAVESGGGGMDNYESSPTLTDCTFKGNSASSWGGGMSNRGSSPTLINCAFLGNSAGSDGGGMSNRGSSPTLTNCTFWGNSADHWGGGIFNIFECSPTLTNCILWGDTPEEIFNYDEVPSPVVTYSDIQGGYPGEGNIDSYPFFVDLASGDFHLSACSPCIDAGNPDPAGLPPYDFEGDDRVLDGDDDGTPTVDMGADEVAVVGTCFGVHLPVVLRAY